MILPTDVSAIPLARRYARTWAEEQRLNPPIVANIQVALIELVANAVKHADPPVQIALRRDGDVIHGEVSDGSATLPNVNSNPDRLGHGLRIVDSYTTRWGAICGLRSKQVWFEIDTHFGE